MTGNRVRRSRRQILAGAGAMLLASLAGCSGDDGGGGNGNGNGNGDGSNGDENGDDGMEDDRTEDAEEVNVEANNFNPQIIEIEPGTTVRWEHRGGAGSHTFTFYHEDNGRQHRVPEGVEDVDEPINNGTKFYEFTFEKAGVYDYYCEFHEGKQMIGSVVVTGNDDPEQPGLAEPDDEDFEPFAAQEIQDLNDQAREMLGI